MSSRELRLYILMKDENCSNGIAAKFVKLKRVRRFWSMSVFVPRHLAAALPQ